MEFDWKSIGTMISKAAPVLGGLLGGPVGAVVGSVVPLIAGALGCEATPDAVAEQLKANPDALLKLKELEFNNKVELGKLSLQFAQLQIEQEKAYLADRSDARKMSMAYVEKTGKADKNLYFLAWTIVIAFFLLVGYLVYLGKAPADTTGVIYMLLGTLSTAFGAVVQFFFGSSSESSKKTDIISQLPALNTALPAPVKPVVLSLPPPVVPLTVPKKEEKKEEELVEMPKEKSNV